MKILLYSYLQLLLLSMNTYNIATGKIIHSIIFSFLIGIVWCYNVTGVAKGSFKDKMYYSIGCSLGCGTGVIFSKYFF
jgi:hypothetical protein